MTFAPACAMASRSPKKSPSGQTAGAEIRVGQGFDVHPLVSGRYLYLGGVRIPYRKGLKGHSDGDVLLHAVMDALLGAAGQGDIGTHFPSGAPEWRGADSRALLRTVCSLIGKDGWQAINLDCTVLAEAPRISPHVRAIRESISGVLGIPVTACAVKATTCEGLGFIGRREGIAAMAVALLRRGA